MRVLWSPSALNEIARVFDYVADFNPAAARRLADALIAVGDSLAALPYRGRPVGNGLQEIVAIHPYILRYEIVGDAVHILRMRHGMRQP